MDSEGNQAVATHGSERVALGGRCGSPGSRKSAQAITYDPTSAFLDAVTVYFPEGSTNEGLFVKRLDELSEAKCLSFSGSRLNTLEKQGHSDTSFQESRIFSSDANQDRLDFSRSNVEAMIIEHVRQMQLC